MNDDHNPICIYCKSNKVIKHGKTTTGNPRYRCRNCGKTWVLERNEPVRPDLADITEAYLGGRTCRDLVSIYHSSPLRINQKIREFLDGCPNWEDYLDACVAKHEPRLIILTGRYFSSATPGAKNNRMFLALAVDALSTVVLGFEIGIEEEQSPWYNLLSRLKSRGISAPSFMSNGSKAIDDAVHSVYPNSDIRLNYHRAYRDKEIACCLYRLPINNKLLSDAVKVYYSLENKTLNRYLNAKREKKLQDILFSSQEEFIRRIKERLENKSKIRVEGLSTSFQVRFEKFHMLKENPNPVINGWVARTMLMRISIGYSRLSLYMQTPAITNFKDFSCGNQPQIMELKEDSPLLRAFVIEIAARGLQLPIVFNRCEMKLDKCSLF